MNRIKYENYLGAAGYDAVARRKIKELEEKVGGGSGGGGDVIQIVQFGPYYYTNVSYEEIKAKLTQPIGDFLNSTTNGITPDSIDCLKNNITFVLHRELTAGTVLHSVSLDGSNMQSPDGDDYIVVRFAEMDGAILRLAYGSTDWDSERRLGVLEELESTTPK